MNFLAALLAKLAQPLLEKLAVLIAEKIKEMQKQKNAVQIEKSLELMLKAKTDEERIEAAREAARANRSW